MLSCSDADVRRDERSLELLQRLRIELAPREYAAQCACELFTRPGEAGGEALAPRSRFFLVGLAFEDVEHRWGCAAARSFAQFRAVSRSPRRKAGTSRGAGLG